jgi:LPS export ABC transporter protein LptC
MQRWFVFVLFLFFVSCKADLSKIRSPEDIKTLPQLSINGFHADYKISSMLRAEAYAPLMNKYTLNKNYVEFPDGLEVKFYDDDFHVRTSLTCDYAIDYPEKELWKFSGNVIIKSVEGGTLKTQELYFDQKTKKIYSIKYVEVTSPDGSVIRGKGGFEANYNFTVYEFKNVDGVINFQRDKF